MTHTIRRILDAQMSVFLPLRLKLQGGVSLLISHSSELDRLTFSYFERGENAEVLAFEVSASFLNTFTSPVLQGWNGISQKYPKLAAYLALTLNSWISALVTFVNSLSDYKLMSLKPQFFLPPPSKSPFYLNSFRDFDEATRLWIKIFKERSP